MYRAGCISAGGAAVVARPVVNQPARELRLLRSEVRVTLSTKGLIAMNAIPSGLKGPLGTELSKVANGPNIDVSAIGLFGGFTKSVGSV